MESIVVDNAAEGSRGQPTIDRFSLDWIQRKLKQCDRVTLLLIMSYLRLAWLKLEKPFSDEFLIFHISLDIFYIFGSSSSSTGGLVQISAGANFSKFQTFLTSFWNIVCIFFSSRLYFTWLKNAQQIFIFFKIFL